MMNERKVHSQGNVPFAWENQPGIAKVTPQPFSLGRYALNLPPPPSQLSSDSPKVAPQHDLYIPLPPCTFNPSLPSRSNSRKGVRGDNDPFLAAYKECTKSVTQGKLVKNGRKGGRSREGRIGLLFSCKNSCGVREDSLVSVCQIPSPIARKDDALDAK